MIIKSQPCFQAMVLSPTVAARVSSKKCGNSSRLSEEEIAKSQTNLNGRNTRIGKKYCLNNLDLIYFLSCVCKKKTSVYILKPCRETGVCFGTLLNHETAIFVFKFFFEQRNQEPWLLTKLIKLIVDNSKWTVRKLTNAETHLGQQKPKRTWATWDSPDHARSLAFTLVHRRPKLSVWV